VRSTIQRFWKYDEAVPVAAAHDLQLPRAGPGDDSLHLPALIARIGKDPLQKGIAPAGLPQTGLLRRLGPARWPEER